MTDTTTQIMQLTENFIVDVTRLAKNAAIQAIQAALGSAVGGGALEAMNTALGIDVGGPVAVKKSRSTSSAPLAKGEKRTQESIEKIRALVLGYIKKNPGTPIEPMGKALELKTSEMALPIKKLIADQQVHTTGHRRATQYFTKAEKEESPKAKKSTKPTEQKANKKSAPAKKK